MKKKFNVLHWTYFYMLRCFLPPFSHCCNTTCNWLHIAIACGMHNFISIAILYKFSYLCPCYGRFSRGFPWCLLPYVSVLFQMAKEPPQRRDWVTIRLIECSKVWDLSVTILLSRTNHINKNKSSVLRTGLKPQILVSLFVTK